MHQKLTEGIEQRLPGEVLHEEKLASFVHFQKDILARRVDDQVEAAKRQAEILKQPQTKSGDLPGEHVRLHAQLAMSLPPVDLSRTGLLRVQLGGKNLPPHDRDPQLVLLRNDRLVDSRSGSEQFILHEICFGNQAAEGNPVRLGVPPGGRPVGLVDGSAVMAAKEVSYLPGIVRVEGIRRHKTNLNRGALLDELAACPHGRGMRIDPEGIRQEIGEEGLAENGALLLYKLAITGMNPLSAGSERRSSPPDSGDGIVG